MEVGAPPLLEEDADEYDEAECDIQVPTVHPAYFMAPGLELSEVMRQPEIHELSPP